MALDANLLKNEPDRVREMLKSRGEDLKIDELLALDTKRRSLQQEVEGLRAERKQRSKALGQLKQQGQDITSESESVRQLGEQLSLLEEKYNEADAKFHHLLLFLPNIPRDSVPKGKSEADNPLVREWGKPKEFGFKAKDHVALGESLDILDFKRATKISGARFSLYKGEGARLERALINFMLDLHTKDHGYTEVIPPFLVNRTSITATGNLPKFEEDVFHIREHGFYLIPTAEVPVTNIHADEIIKEEDLPIAYVAYTPCFRSEAGSYGKDTRGLIRQHQFNKVELVQFTLPEQSLEALEQLTAHAEKVLQALDLHYRVVELCTGDLGFSSSKTYDLEVWLPGQSAYREISSCSNFSDFQARRAKIRYRSKADGKPQLLHTLNGSGLAVGRTLVAILEQHQEKDGRVLIPKSLRPYMNNQEYIG